MFIMVVTSPEKVRAEGIRKGRDEKQTTFTACLRGVLAPIGGLLIVTPAAADLVLNFNNDRPDASSLPAYITFTGAPVGDFDATIAGKHSTPGGRQLQSFDSRRWRGCHKIHIWPGFRFPRLPLDRPHRRHQLRAQFRQSDFGNFLTRMDKYEITYGVPASGGAPTGGANLLD
jgi:hypothetical protein